ncbi:asparagine--tRNA ligase [Zhongshania sp.]|jgi:asparaginyl-tRNA synthetase|uniref:asparagine--tRNA ligase n=1 Tax=Zhongshania sp. TaxID=1971902 RepID=UPI001B534959|nr:asparagine--tRNA ligase [Zhongshania sp.]MBQ0760652.1 asparagine--tRNA ligase [Zhongshania sp.]MBQ0796575.1 asparagine--tRNA ligase [Zhongshania sp.]
MSAVSIKALLAGQREPGCEVTVKGWIRSRRDSKGGFSFLAVHDGSAQSAIQVVAPGELTNYDADILKLTAGCSVIVIGDLVASQGKGQSVEIQAKQIEVCGWVDDPDTYPIAKKRHSFEYLRTVAHLRPRTNTFGAITRVRTVLANAVHRYFYERGFQWINSPLITASDCEGAGEMFRVSTLDLMNLPRAENGNIDFSEDFFGKEAFLTVSGQLNAEAYCLAMSKVYTFGPTFRAENSNTSRHLAEFWMVEPEIAFANLDDDAALAEDFLRYLLSEVLEHCEDDLAFFNQYVDEGVLARLQKVASTSFERMDYSDAIKILEKSGKKFEYPVRWGLDMQSEHERYLCEEHVGGPLIVTNYPKDIKAFYMRMNDDEKTVAAMDVLAPGIGEIIGGSQREERLDVLERRMAEQGLEGLEWYRDLRRYGTVAHAGFGLGFERLLNYITGMENIRDAIPFPRTPKHADY